MCGEGEGGGFKKGKEKDKKIFRSHLQPGIMFFFQLFVCQRLNLHAVKCNVQSI